MNDYVNKSPVEYEEIKIVATKNKYNFSSIGRKIVVPQKNRSSERKPVYIWQYFGQPDSSYHQQQLATDSSYYQPQPFKYN